MKRLVSLSFALIMMGFFGCQAAYKIKPELFPRKQLAETITLTTTTGDEYQLADIYGEHTGTVVIFWQSKCPCVKRYQDRITKLFDRYGQDGIAMLYVASNSNDAFGEAVKEYETRKSPLPLMRDEGGKLAQLLSAKGTPTAAVFNQAGDLIYMGWVDNERYEHESGRIAYLEDALKDLIAKRPITTPTSPMFGCEIK